MEAEVIIMRGVIRYLVVMVAALRVAWWHRRLPLDQLVERVRQVPKLPTSLRDPAAFRVIVHRWYGRLPPRGLRACLKQSYLLLDLWSRCALDPVFHLGVRTVDGKKDGHAWLTVEGFDCADTPEDGYRETFVA